MPARLLRLGVVSLTLAVAVMAAAFVAVQALSAPAPSSLPALSVIDLQATTTPAASASVSFGQGSFIQIVDPAGRRSVDFFVSPLRADVPFTLHALPEDRLRAVYAATEAWRPLTVDLTGLTQTGAWTESVTGQDSRARTRIPASVPPGVYVLSSGSDPATRAQLIIVLTRYVALLKGGEGQVAVWTRRLQDGAAPPSPAQVQIVKNDATVAQMAADAQGWASADLVWDDKMLALVRVGGELTVVGFRYEWQNDWSRWWGGGPSPYQDRRVYLYTDRPIYRPDQEVNFKAVLRGDRDGSYSLPLPTDAVTVTLKDPRANVVATQRLTVGEFGAVDGMFRLGQEASLGTYQLEVAYAGVTTSRGVEVQAYRKPEYEVTVAATPDPLILGDPLRVSVTAAYYFSAPVPNAPLTVKLKYGGGWWWGGSGVAAEVSGVTDGQGRWSGELPTGNVNPYNTALTVEASVTDATGQVVTGQASVQGYWASVDLQSSQSRYAYPPGETVTLGFTARDRQGRPVAGQTMDLVITRYFSQDPTRSNRSLVTDAAGQATLTLPNSEAGWYSLEAVTKDSRGRESRAYAYWWVFEPGQGGWWTQDGQVELQADAPSYRPGDTARLLVRSALTGPALLTVERGRVRREQVVQLTGAATVVEVPLVEGDAPNVFARLHIWQPYGASQAANWGTVPEGRLLVSNALELPVAANAKRLAVGVQADKAEYRPGETAVLTLDVKDALGQGQRAEVSVALVDEAIYALASDTTPDPFDHFYGRRSLAVNGWDSLRPTRYGGWRDTLPAPAPTGTPAPGGPAVPPAAPGAAGQPVRQDFRDTAYWNARVVTDAQGRAVISVPLPDNLTRWRVVVRAVTAQTLAGQGQGSLLVTKPVAVSPGMPRFLTLGDRVSLDTVVTNRTGAAVNASVNLTGTGLLRLSGPPLTLIVPPGGQRSVSWSVVASQVGQGTLTCAVDTGALGDAVATPLPIQPFAVPERQAQAGLVDGSVDLRFRVPLNAVSEASVAELRLAPSVALSLLDGLDDLVGYPYGCVEQTMSRVLPNAAVAQTYRRLGISNPDLERRLPDIMADGLQRLYGFQRPDGGWGWWYDDDSAVYQTTYVLFGLLQVRAAGFDVSDAVLQRGLDWLQNALTASPTDPTRTPTPAPRSTPATALTPAPTATPDLSGDTGLDPRLRAYALYVLALGGRADLPSARNVLAQPDRLDAFGLAALGLTLHGGGDTASAERAADLLAHRAIETGGRVHWAAATDSAYLWRTMQSDEKATGMALRALAQVQPASPLLPGAARWLMDQRRGQGWSTTQGTAFAVLGLTDYILVSGELDADYTWRVVRGGVVLAQGHVDRANATQPIPPIVLRGADLLPGENTLHVEKTGAGKLYYSLSTRLSLFYPQFEPVSSADTGIRMERSYSLSEPGPGRATPAPAITATPTPGRGTALPIPYPSPTPTQPPQTEFRLGDVVETRLVVETAEEMSYVLIEDHLPAGFEPLYERVNPYIWEGGPWAAPPVWRDYGYNRKELRDDRVTFFVTWLGAGRHEFTYRMRATRPGLFSALPAEAYPMYRPDIWGRSASDQLTVERAAFTNPTPMKADVDRSCAVTEFDVRQVALAWTTEDGRRKAAGTAVSVAEVAQAQANLGRTCLTGEAATLDPVAMTPSLRLVAPPTDPVVGGAFTVDVALDGAVQTRGYEASLSFDPSAVRLDGVDGLAGAVTLGALIDGARGQARWGVVLAEPTAGRGLVVARLRLTALQPGAFDLTLRDALVLDAHDQPHAPALASARLVVGGFRLWLPLVKRAEP